MKFLKPLHHDKAVIQERAYEYQLRVNPHAYESTTIKKKTKPEFHTLTFKLKCSDRTPFLQLCIQGHVCFFILHLQMWVDAYVKFYVLFF